jgi:WbqC-like protein family
LTLVAIHQPTFLPWLGWWDKLVRADVFVLLDDVQFPKKGGTWMNRVRMLIGGEARWVTVPVDRSFHGTRAVREMRFDTARPWRDDILRTLGSSYGRASHFAAVMPVVEEALARPTDRIAELNESAIRCLAGPLGLDTSTLVHQSDIGIAGTSNELLVALCRAVGGDAYLSGDGAGGYLSEQAFADAGLELRYQEFTAPPYPQQVDGSHEPGLSVVDALMNCGWEGTAGLLRAR